MNVDFRKVITTERLVLEPLSNADGIFILELVNTPGWLEFIGDKKIHSIADANAYIQKIKATENIYWTVKLNDTRFSIGLVTFIKRDYLPYHDFGFALLPTYYAQGYALEATKSTLAHLVECMSLETILAISLPKNVRSINLLLKLGFNYEKEVRNAGDTLLLYKASGKHLILLHN